MCVRNAPRADVHIQALVERTDLTLAVDLGMFGAAADGPVDAADAIARLENAEVVAELVQFVGDDEAGDAGAEDDDVGFRGTASERWAHASLSRHQLP